LGALTPTFSQRERENVVFSGVHKPPAPRLSKVHPRLRPILGGRTLVEASPGAAAGEKMQIVKEPGG